MKSDGIECLPGSAGCTGVNIFTLPQHSAIIMDLFFFPFFSFVCKLMGGGGAPDLVFFPWDFALGTTFKWASQAAPKYRIAVGVISAVEVT